MKFWTHQELHEIEEKLLDRKSTIDYLEDKRTQNIPWPYEEWEDGLLECAARIGCTIDALEKFLHRTKGDVTRHIRQLGYENWVAYCEVVQGVSRENVKRINRTKYRDIVEAAVGRPLTKEEHVHHVNCDHYDDALNNLWLCNRANHRHAHASYRDLQKSLIAYGVVTFNRETGDYGFDPDAVDDFMQHWEKRDENTQETADFEKDGE